MINPNEKSKIVNLCPYPVSWERITIMGDEYLKPNSSMFVLNSELQTQIENGNFYLVGTDGCGSHANIYIENPEIREFYLFDDKNNNKKQLILDEERCKYILGLKTMQAFDKNLKSDVITTAEKIKIMDIARKIKLNDYSKITILEEYCNEKY